MISWKINQENSDIARIYGQILFAIYIYIFHCRVERNSFSDQQRGITREMSRTFLSHFESSLLRDVMHVIPIEAIKSKRVESTLDLGRAKEEKRERKRASDRAKRHVVCWKSVWQIYVIASNVMLLVTLSEHIITRLRYSRRTFHPKRGWYVSSL